jgi:peptide/nickel transport system permease protein
VFAFPGIGQEIFSAITNKDYAVLQGAILVIAVLYVLINLVVDILYGVLDPRVRVR